MSDESSGRWATFAAIGSAVAAFASLAVSCQERHTPYNSALYTARWSAIEDYAKASANLSTALHLAAIAVPREANDPATLAKMSDAELLKAANAARPAITAWGDYVAASSADGQPWTETTHTSIESAEAAGRSAYECYRRLGAYVEGDVIPKGWWPYLRQLAAEPCRDFRNPAREAKFDRAARTVLRTMTDELRQKSDQFVPGAPHNPED